MRNPVNKLDKKTPKQELQEKLSAKLHQALKGLGVDVLLVSKKIEKSAKKIAKNVLKKKALKTKELPKSIANSVVISKPIKRTTLVTKSKTMIPAKPATSQKKLNSTSITKKKLT